MIRKDQEKNENKKDQYGKKDNMVDQYSTISINTLNVSGLNT